MVKICIISIGDEILIGHTINSNATWMGQYLNSIGFDVAEVRTIHDTETAISTTIKECFEKFDVIISTGGLGPTNDDVTMPVLADFFHSKISINEKVLDNVKELLSKRSIKINENNRNQALMPEKAEPIMNSIGTAPGLFFDKKGKYVFTLPGVPKEMKGMMENFVGPKLKKHWKPEIILHKIIMTEGIAESILAEKIKEWEDALPKNLKLAYLPQKGRVKLRISAFGTDKKAVNKKIQQAVDDLKQIIPEYIFSYDNEEAEAIIGKLLKKKRQTLSTAESCTGGKIAHKITSIAGSSDYFKGSIIAYSNEVKEKLLHVSKKDIDKYGAVSQEVAEQMAVGVQKALQTDCSISTTGIAGPSGASKDKPVGTIWIAVAAKNKVQSKQFNFNGNREENIERFTNSALLLLLNEIS